MRAPAIAALSGGAVALAIGAYFLQDKVRCDRLEQDYLNSVDSLRGSAIIRSAAPSNAEIQSNMDELEKLQLQSLESSLNAVYEQCGTRAGRNAARKGTDLMTGI